MATRSSISARVGNSVFTIYCHWDGYPSHNGEILLDHYDTQEKIEKLIVLGDLSILAESTDCPDGHTFDNPIRGYCVAYGRDRGELKTRAREYLWMEGWKTYARDSQEYDYYWDGDQWFVNGKSLDKVISQDDDE